jgi:hypothetical protein
MVKKTLKMKSNNELMANTMSKSGFTFTSAIHELLDNSIVTAKNISVNLLVDNYGQRSIKKISVIDDGAGISLAECAIALSVGARTNQGIHEHGVGLKSAIAYFGDTDISKGLEKIYSYDGVDSYAITGYEGNDLHIDDGLPIQETTGTKIIMNVLLNVFAAKRVNSLKESLGVRYANFISKGGSIVINEVDLKTKEIIKDAKGNPTTIVVPSITPPYFHPTTLTNVHLFKTDITTQNIVAELTIGMSPDNHEGVWAKQSYGGGIDVVQNDRVIMHRTFEPLTQWRPKNHTSLNSLVGQLVIKEGHLATTPKKDNLQQNDEWMEVKKVIAEAIKDAKITSFFNPPENDDDYDSLSESLIRDGLAEYLNAQTLPNGAAIWTDVKTEESTDTNLSMDVTAFSSETMYVFEVKKGNFNAQDMNQLIGYMVTVGAKHGVVFAKNVLANAKKQFNEHWKPLLKDFHITYWEESSAQHKTVLSTYVDVGN